jgi:hypothetical protein
MLFSSMIAIAWLFISADTPFFQYRLIFRLCHAIAITLSVSLRQRRQRHAFFALLHYADADGCWLFAISPLPFSPLSDIEPADFRFLSFATLFAIARIISMLRLAFRRRLFHFRCHLLR